MPSGSVSDLQGKLCGSCLSDGREALDVVRSAQGTASLQSPRAANCLSCRLLHTALGIATKHASMHTASGLSHNRSLGAYPLRRCHGRLGWGEGRPAARIIVFPRADLPHAAAPVLWLHTATQAAHPAQTHCHLGLGNEAALVHLYARRCLEPFCCEGTKVQ